ncbi:MAG TPA: ATP-dependent RNA helicase HrpA [Steroidobacteraceae bacterium]|nr:ATP-dependent RNA helicase HrpA [Steroidobacteraceae bacterium]
MRLEYDPALPITAHRVEILEALARHPVMVVCGATGSGKTTQLPKFCLEAGRGTNGLIGHTQPRRIAARALAARLAQELGTTVDVPGKRKGRGGAGGRLPTPANSVGLVGYKVRFNDRTGPNTRVKLMTDGILLKELESDRNLRRYDTLIIDEAHERSLNIDLLLGVLKQLSPRRPDLRVIVTSATIDPAKFSNFFGGAPVIEVSGRSYPVEIRYRPLIAEDEDAAELSLPEGIVEAVRDLDRNGNGMRGDTLVFLPGEKHIREASEALGKAQLRHTEVLPLFARLSARDQERIFAPHTGRRVVLATNVAETSLTVPGIRFVVDSGLARISRYSVRGKVQRLPIERISKASADQRKGRCGREAAGICIRLYSEEEFSRQEDFTPPEVLRTNLASVILRMAALGLGEPENFPFLDAPDTRLVNDGVRLLQELKAMDDQRRVTSLGAKIAGLPVDPRLGRMLLAASHHNCVTEMLAITAFLEAQDPRERPSDAQQQSAEKHALFADARSDFVTVLNLWRAFKDQSAALSGSQLRKWCREHFLSFMRMREWQELHSQLSQSVRELELHPNQAEASYTDLHQAILTGFLGSIGNLDEKREYDGPRGMRFVIAPGTPLASKPPKWVVAGSLLETTRLYARMVAAVDSSWIESAGAHLIKRSYSEPHWVEGRAFVAAFESVSLYGLTLASRRRVNYGAIAPIEAREIFIREALIGGDDAGRRAGANGAVRGDFLHANRKLREEIEALEAKIRRRDILVDEQAQMEFYAKRIPERVSSGSAFEHWRAGAERENPRVLYMSREDLMQRDAPDASAERSPDDFAVGGNRLPLKYKFEPAEPDDGVTLVVPEPLVDMLLPDRLAWLVPGMRLEKVTAVFRALPKALRKPLVPVPDHAREALAGIEGRSGSDLPGFYEWLAHWVTQRVGAPVTAADLAALALPGHLRMNIRVVDAQDRVLAEGRDLAAIRKKLYGAAGSPALTDAGRLGRSGAGGSDSGRIGAKSAPHDASRLHRQWDFGDLAETAEVERNRLRLAVYPAVEDRTVGVALVEARSPADAELISRTGLARLAMLLLPQQAKYVAKRMADDRELVLLSRGLPLEGSVADALTRRAFRECFLPADQPLPRSERVFASLLESRRSQLNEVADRLTAIVTSTFKEWRAVRIGLEKLGSPSLAGAVGDIKSQLGTLLPPDFIESVPRPWLDYLPRYLKAIGRRMERLPANTKRDEELAAKVKPFIAGVHDLVAKLTRPTVPPQLFQLRWMIEEYRVSLFAQELKTPMKVSDKRLAEQLEAARVEARG